MQYILSQQELDQLHGGYREQLRLKDSVIQNLCISVAEHQPIERDRSPDDAIPDDKSPWGCILVEGGKNHHGYCDKCPAQDACPYQHKNWSK